MSDPGSHEGRRRYVLAIIGYAGGLEASIEALCVELGRAAVTAGFRIVTGGLGGVMEAVSRGAHDAPSFREGDVIGVLPGYDRSAANPYVDVVIPTGMQIGRNVILVAMADVVLAIGGGAGTLSELAVAWQLGKPILTLASTGGWGERLAGERLDARRDDPVHSAATPGEAITLALALAERRGPDSGEIGSNWKKTRPT
ncbi:MAG: TIGR00725 family protein [Byssovorax sp.]